MINRPEQIRPLGNKVLIRKDAKKTQTESGIILPDTQRDVPTTGTVLAVGDGFFTVDGVSIPLDVKPGDRVIFKRNVGHAVTVGKETLHLIPETEIIAVETDE